VKDSGQELMGAVAADLVMTETAVAVAQPKQDLVEVAIREHARLVYRIAYSVLRNEMDAEDAVQETFLRVLRHGKKIDAVRDQKAWLAQIAWRVAVERRRRVLHEAARTEDVGESDGLLAPGQRADRALLEKERNEFLQRMIAALPDQMRDALVLSTLEELSPREVGAMLGISEAAVRARSFRGRQILRERMVAWMGGGK
jgi:RNA polymerase sigma-70 factor, ECF subfamily